MTDPMTTTTSPSATDPRTTWLYQHVARPDAPLQELTLPRRYQDTAVDDIDDAGLARCVRKYGRDFWQVAPAGIAPFFAGNSGVGKTYAASVLARAIHAVHRIPVAWCNCAEELVWFDREAFSTRVAARIAELKRAPFVVMDDFTQFTDGRQLNLLTEIAAVRYDECLPTLWTGNVVLKKDDYEIFEKAVGAMLARRILQMSEGYRVMSVRK
jgi:DNA replication protein DnaC